MLLYAYDKAAGQRHERAAQLVQRLAADPRGALSVQVLQEFYVNVTRKIEQTLDHATAVARVRALSRWPTHVPRGGDVIMAAESAARAQLSSWDAMIVRSASVLGCPTLWSEDLGQGRRADDVVVRTPFPTTERRPLCTG